MQTAIIDTSVIINLSAIEQIQLLNEFHKIVIAPTAVVAEINIGSPDRPGKTTLMNAIDSGKIIEKEPQNRHLVTALHRNLGMGESEVIALCLETDNSLAILDDKDARETADDMGIPFTGTIGMLMKAKRENKIVSVLNQLETLQTKTGFRISDNMKEAVLVAIGEKTK